MTRIALTLATAGVIALVPLDTTSQIVPAAVGAGFSGVTTAVAAGQLKTLIDKAMDKAANTGDFIIFRAGTELKSLLDSFLAGNQALLNEAFEKLNASQQAMFNNIRVTAEKLNGDVSAQMEALTKLGELANQTVQDARIFDGKMGVLRYSPRVLYPGMGEAVLVVRGVNVDAADPQLVLPDGTLAKRVGLTRQEANFVLPANVFPHDPQQSATKALQLRWVNPTGFFGSIGQLFGGDRKPVSTDLALRVLPQQMGTFGVSGVQTEPTRAEWNAVRRMFSFTGKDDSRTFNQAPHDNGWRIQTGTLAKVDESGRAGRGCAVSGLNENGFSVTVSVGKVSTGLNPSAPGDQYCYYNWTEYLTGTQDTPFATAAVPVGWQSDQPFTLPAVRKNVQLQGRLFDGATRVSPGADSGPYYEVLESGNTLIVRPKIPKDFTQ